VHTFDGEWVWVTRRADAVQREVLAVARRNAALFGTGTDSMYRIGPHRNLIGTLTSAHRISDVAGAGVRLDDVGALDAVRTRSAFVPVRIAGGIRGLSKIVGSSIAIAVNGRIAAVTRSFKTDGQARFVGLVPEDSLRDGSNDVDVYAVRVTDGGIALARLGGNRSTPRLAHSPKDD
jgi:hypothetical protein